MKKIISFLLVFTIIYPLTVSAAWWNPFTWFPKKPNVVEVNKPITDKTTLKSPELYKAGGLMARIRLQGEFSAAWEKETPKISVVLAEIGDKSAPVEYRSYVVNSFRNISKMNKFSKEDLTQASQGLLKILQDSSDSVLVRVTIANMLYGLGEEGKLTEAIFAISSLLDESDEIGSGAVTALRHTGTDASADALFAWLSKNYTQINSKPNTVVSGITALFGHGKLNIAPIITKTVPLITSGDVLMGLLQNTVRMKDSEEKTRSLEQGYNALIKMGSTTQAERVKVFIKKPVEKITETSINKQTNKKVFDNQNSLNIITMISETSFHKNSTQMGYKPFKFFSINLDEDLEKEVFGSYNLIDSSFQKTAFVVYKKVGNAWKEIAFTDFISSPSMDVFLQNKDGLDTLSVSFNLSGGERITLVSLSKLSKPDPYGFLYDINKGF